MADYTINWTLSGSLGGSLGISGSMIPDSVANPTLPTEYSVPAYSLPTGGTTHNCDTSAELTTALAAAVPGDVIVLTAGNTFTGPFTVPEQDGSDWIYIISSAMASLPSEGTRVTPSDATNMPSIQSPNEFNQALFIDKGAQKIRIVGCEIESTYADRAVIQYSIFRIGYTGTSEDNADNIVIDRCYIHSTASGNNRDGIAVKYVTNFAVINSHVSEWQAVGSESHGIHLYQVPGPSLIENNYISAAGINMFMGDNDGDGAFDTVVRGNHIAKVDRWNDDHASYDGYNFACKNLIEIKRGARLLIEGNLFENSWVDAQHGQVFLLTPRAGDVSDVTIRRNFARNFEGIGNINSTDHTLRRVVVEDNVFDSGDDQSHITMTNRYGIQVAGAPGDCEYIYIRHNTFISGQTSGFIIFNGDEQDEITSFNLKDNLVSAGVYGIMSNGQGVGYAGVSHFCSSWDIEKNALIGGTLAWFGDDTNFVDFSCPANDAAVGFTDTTFDDLADFVLTGGSAYKSAGSDGEDYGADISLIQAALNDAA